MDSGFYYATKYIAHLEKHGQTDRLELLRDSGSGYHGLPPPKFSLEIWEDDKSRINLTGFKIYHYTLDRGVSASEGLDQMLPGKSKAVFFIDCAMAVQLAHYCALRVIFGQKLFDAYFDREGKKPLLLTARATPLLQFYELQNDRNPPQYGENCYFRNVRAYKFKHMYGDDCGQHVICSSKGESEIAFEGFGLPKPGMKAHEIFIGFADEFNLSPVPLIKLVSKEIAKKADGCDRRPLPHIIKQIAEGVTVEEIEKIADEDPDLVGLSQNKMRLSAARIRRVLENQFAHQ